MRDLLVFASLVALALAIRGAMRLPVQALPPGLLPYLGAQAIFTACAWIASQRFFYSDDGYHKIYYLTATPMLICLAAFTGRAIINAGAWPLFAVAAVLTLGLYDTLNREIPETDFIKIQASVFVTCGVLLIATLAHPESPLVVRIRLALGFFLLVQGFFLYFFAFGIVRFRAAAITHSYWIPAFAALTAFSWLAIYFAGMHSELVRQADAGNELLETRWVSLQLQEVYRIAVSLVKR